MLVSSILSLLAGGVVQPSPPVAPVIRVASPEQQVAVERQPILAKWVPGEIVCDNGATLPGSTINAVIPQFSIPRSSADQTGYSFVLGPQGRALSIDVTESVGSPRRASFQSDIAPAIAGSEFPAFEEPTRCVVSFDQQSGPITEADFGDLVRTRSFNRNARIPSSAWDRVAPGNCNDKPSSRPLVLAYPDFRKLPGPPGARDWVLLTYNLDADGETVEVGVAESSGNAALDSESVAAVEASRYTGSDRTGCVRYFWTGVGVVKAPERPPLDSYGPRPEGCDADDRWEREPRLRYPNAYQRRGIEGWAVLRYDVAPWGEIGNVEVLDSQPTAEFARFATTILTSARYAERNSGLKGCIDRVFFRLPDSEEEAAAEG